MLSLFLKSFSTGKYKNVISFCLLIVLFNVAHCFGQKLAFPTAEGYGKYTLGGRGGKVIEVTNLNDSGDGSLRAAVNASGPRTVVFKVSGTITLNSELKISNPFITIAGQTAPGDGICLRRYPLNISANQVIIRYIRVRFGDESGSDADAISSRYVKNIIVDHVSASWSVDETMSIYHCDSVTVQWSLIAESMYNSNHEKGAHGFGGIWGSNYGSYHHNLLANHSSRNPRFASGCGNTDYRNNVIYNWGYNSAYGGELQQVGDANHAFTNINMVANYYKPGPATVPGAVSYRIVNPSSRSGATDFGKWYVADNYVVGSSATTANNWNGVHPDGGSSFIAGLKLDQPWPAMAINQQTAEAAYNSVLEQAGCSFPKRDPVDARIISDTKNGDATFEGLTYKINNTVPDALKICGIIDSQSDVGGWPELKTSAAPTDTDKDGIPDDWEKTHGLNPNDVNDGSIFSIDNSFTNLEVYLNSIIKIVTDVSVTGISISPKTKTISRNSSEQLTATVSPSDATNNTVLWTSRNSSIATVNNFGVVKGLSVGTVRIIAATKEGGFKDSCDVTVINSAVTGVTLQDKASVRVGGTTQLNAVISPANASNKNVTWNSSDLNIAKVSSTGVVTGVAAGNASIRVITEDGNFSATCAVSVYTSVINVPVPLIKLDFNENAGSTLISTGKIPATFKKTTPPAWSSNVPINGGASSIDFGTTVGDYYVESDSVISQLAGLANFTITGWVNCTNTSVGSGGNRIVSWIYNGANGVDLVYVADGSIKLGINQWPDNSTAISNAAKISVNAAALNSNWKFFSVSYESSTGSCKFYFGDNANPAGLDKELTYNQGTVGKTIGKLAIGHFNSESSRTTRTNRMFRGMIDQIKIFGSALSASEIQTVQYGEVVGIEADELNDSKLPTEISLSQNYPNPFNPTTKISYQLPKSSFVTLKVYDLLGKEVANLVNENKNAGKYFATFDAGKLSSGIYIYTLMTDNFVQSRKMLLIK